MNYQNFENQTFNEFSNLIQASNFKNCVFNEEARFERCNLNNCTFNKGCVFDRCNVIACNGDGLTFSIYNKSNKTDKEFKPPFLK